MIPDIFQIEFPSEFVIERLKKTSFRASNSLEKFDIQQPYFTISLIKIGSIKTDKEKSLLDNYMIWSEGFKTELLSQEEIRFKGYKTYVLHQKTDAVFAKQSYKINYFNACIVLDDTYCVDFSFTYETALENTYKTLVEKVFQSVEVKGEADLWKKALLEDEEDLQNQIQTNRRQEELNRQKEQYQRYKNLSFQTPEGNSSIKLTDTTFVLTDTYWNFNNQQLAIHLTLQSDAHQELINQELIPDWQSKDKPLTLSIKACGIYTNGVPTGQFFIENSKDKNQQISIRLNGFATGLEFYGNLYLEKGWVALEGWLNKSYEQNTTFRISLYQKLDITDLNWLEYAFNTSEFKEAPSEIVGYLNYKDSEMTSFPSKILECKNLKHLNIQGGRTTWTSNKYVSTHAPIFQIPKEMGNLTHLTRLQLLNLSCPTLPKEIGALHALEWLNIQACKLKLIPESLFQLPNLKWFILNRTKLKSIPNKIHLPALQRLDLNNNQLTTLPESVALQPNLSTLELEENPWESLPQNIVEVSTLALEIEVRNKLLDNIYPGADGKGTIEWDDTMYWSAQPTDFTKLDLGLEQYNLKPLAAFFKCVMKKGIGFNLKNTDEYQNLGNTRIGGHPDLPSTITYPRFGENPYENKKDYVYEFIAQINCEEIAHLQDYLPRKGMLYFFLTTIHDVYESENAGKVLYYNGEETLVSGKNLSFEKEDYFEVMESPAYSAYQADAFEVHTLPNLYSANQNKHWFKDDEEREAVVDKYDSNDDFISFEEELETEFDLGVHTYMFSQHENAELEATQKYRGNPTDWIILLHISSCGSFQWGDAGDLAFVIHKSDLAKRDFSKVFVCMESS